MATGQKSTVQGRPFYLDTARLSWLTLAGVMLVSAAYVGAHLRTGWVPHDDGILGQGALRVLHGQLPHRDFTEIYTGGLDFLHGAFFRLFGVNLLSLRISVFLFFLGWLPAVFYISSRFVSPLAAGATTLMAAVWTLPNYPAAMPSWYNLFLATFGAAALLRYLQVGKRQWLFVAGVCGGISVLIKIIGAYYIAGALLFFVLLEQGSDHEEHRQSRSWFYRAFVFCSLGLFLYVLILVTGRNAKGAEVYHFMLPSMTIAALIVIRERFIQPAKSIERFARLFRLLIPFIAGIAVPILIFLIPYIRSGAVHTLIGGNFSSVSSRAVGLAVARPLLLSKAIYAMPLAVLIILAVYWDGIKERFGIIVVGLLSALTAVILWAYPTSLGPVWCSAAALTPLIVLIGAGVLIQDRKNTVFSKSRHHQILLFLSLAALCSLVQFPFPVPIYFCYAAPITLFAIAALVGPTDKRRAGYVFAPVLALYIFFAVGYLVPSYIYELTYTVGKTDTLNLPRAGGIRVEFSTQIESLIHFLQQQSPNGQMLAANDCADLYFLSGLTNPTNDDGGAAPEVILKAIQSNDLKLVVINEAPFFPGARPDPQVKAQLAHTFPFVMRSGGFLIFWRGPDLKASGNSATSSVPARKPLSEPRSGNR
ncbi:MAG TPA: hypothetical protein VKE93_21425 [Candidatus Angelobacter sp.]|nr:hypothetical protein [Candidatus Angelobacter sp.]